MADAAVGLNATDLFALGGNFSAQNSSTMTMLDRAMMLDANGNQQCETMINQRDEVTVSYAYCNAVPDIKTDLATFLTKFGDVQGGYLITGLTINFAAGEYATVDITGHQHNANAHAAGVAIGYSDVSASVPANAGYGVPTMTGVTLGANATPISTSITLSMNHIDVINATGAHFVGKNLTPTAEISVQYQGVPTTAQPFTGWTTDSYGGSDGNSEFDTYDVTAHRYFDLAAA
jgi:hypothetical protein